jgi:hypothetical protein
MSRSGARRFEALQQKFRVIAESGGNLPPLKKSREIPGLGTTKELGNST